MNETEMEHNVSSINSKEYLWSFKGEIDFVDQWMLMNTPIPLIIISILYLSFVLKVGPSFMKNRLPFDLNNVLIIYNAVQVALSCYLSYIGTNIILQNGILGKTCMMETVESRYHITASTYMYFFAKVIELLDTIFFVLRKKNNQISFLHVYHHMCMVWLTWLILKYEPSFSAIFLGTLNSIVHIIMYSYYGLSAIPGFTKYLWWKKYITTMQLIQFGIIILQATASSYHQGCPPTRTLMTMIYVNATLFIYLFSKFYINSYANGNEKKSKVK